MKVTFIPTVFEILLFEDRSILAPTQRETGSERVKLSVKNKKQKKKLSTFVEIASKVIDTSLGSL